MSTYKPDGGVIPSGVPQSTRNDREHLTSFGLYRGQVVRVVYPDDPKNVTKNRVEYVVRINGQDYPNAVSVNGLGAIYNKSETILHPIEKSITGEIAPNTFEENMDGEIVYVLFLNGHANIPVIIGSADHPRQDFKTKKEDGLYDRREYNGVEVSIDKNSNYRIAHVGRKDKDGKILNDKAPGTYVELSGNGDIEINSGGTQDTAGVRAKFTKESKKMEFYAQENKVIYDGNGVSITDKNNNQFTFASAGVTIKSVAEAKMEGTDVTIKGSGNAKFEGTGGTDVGSGGSVTNVKGTQVMLAGGGKPVASVGSQSIGVGNLGAPVISNIISGSPKVFVP